MQNFGDFSAAVGKVAGRRANAALMQAENYRNAAGELISTSFSQKLDSISY